MMKKIINFLLVLAIGVFLGYVFHTPIDVKLKERFGEEKIEETRAVTEEKLRNGAETTAEVGQAMIVAGKEAIDSSNAQ